MVIFLDDRSSKENKISMAQVQVNYQNKKLYMVTNVLKYGIINPIIFYYSIYSELLNTMGFLFRTPWN